MQFFVKQAFSNHTMPVNANIDLSGAISSLISSFNKQSINRSEATQLIAEHFAVAYPDKNCMVVHSQHLESLNNKVHEHIELPQKVGTIGFEIYVFDDGPFTLIGDGGYDNWAFYGEFDFDGNKKVQFHKRQ